MGGAGISVQTAAVSSMRSSAENLWSAPKSVVSPAQCSNFTGMRPVFGDNLISFGVVWYSGMRKWYAGFSVVVAAVGVVPGAKPCKSAGITRVYPGFSRYTRKIPGILPILPILPPRRHSDSL